MTVKVKKGDFTGPSGQPVYNQNPIANWQTPTGWQFSEAVTRIRYFVDENSNLIAFPVVITDANGDTPAAINTAGPGLADNSTTNPKALTVLNYPLIFNGTGFDKLRSGPNLMTGATLSNTGTTTLIGAGGAGVKFRIWKLTLIQNAAAASAGTFSFGDAGNTTGIVNAAPVIPGTAAIEAGPLVIDFRPNGLLQPTANSAVQIILSSTGNMTAYIEYSNTG